MEKPPTPLYGLCLKTNNFQRLLGQTPDFRGQVALLRQSHLLLQMKDIRGCLASGEIVVTSERTLYHEEEWARLLDGFQAQIRTEFQGIKERIAS